MFHDLRFFVAPLKARFGDWTTRPTAQQTRFFATLAQAMAFESHRAMFEAYTRNRYARSTGVIQWMLNSPWPSNIWHLFDYFNSPSA